ncbi:formyltetrahydrofolate deformylase [Exilibacterium tricleocarpae]|uniref:Formyltetrahydrofolate deformylase n=1 Tax=Exilibacterium tricleocarpae TaxID=2591008 RepID=A0A545SZW7_9GAMM|nr:formyltetrahydrofolate deformylase [Exilibacterium tricleocarpae]TQV70518.1 formyltetrahydrofolate deformylase [Exilibacterium tricleocarpae]
MSAIVTPAYSQYILTFKCRDQLGVLASVSNTLYSNGAFITEISHYGDPDTGQFFSRTVFDDRTLNVPMSEFKQIIALLAQELGMEYVLRSASARRRVLVAVSKYNHCLNVLLTKWCCGALDIDIVGVISNHENCRAVVEFYGLPYHYLPITPATKPQQEAQILRLLAEYDVDLLVLARYMQILSDGLCEHLGPRAINIHHSFLPGFKGAKPYHQAHDRGVKVIGATAHYVTADLDEGPIIVQEVEPIDHRLTAEQMVHVGHDIEATALARAVKLHCEERVVMNGNRTVIL